MTDPVAKQIKEESDEKKEQSSDIDRPNQALSIIDCILYVPFIIAWIGALLFFDVLQRIALLFGSRWHEKTVDWLNATLVLLLRIVDVGVRVRYEVPLKRDAPCLVLANHQSLYDIPILHAVFRSMRPRFVAKEELSKWIPSVSVNLRSGGAAIIDRDNPRQAITELMCFAERMMEDKFTGILFPEGTRARDGEMREFQSGGVAAILRKVDAVKVIPVTIEGSWRLYPRRYGPIPRGTLIRVTVHKPLLWKSGDDVEALVKKAELCIRNRQLVDRERRDKGALGDL